MDEKKIIKASFIWAEYQRDKKTERTDERQLMMIHKSYNF